MSNSSYVKLLASRTWACPTCVPEFKTKLKIKFKKQIDLNKILTCILKCLQSDFMDNNVSDCECKLVFIPKIFDKLKDRCMFEFG